MPSPRFPPPQGILPNENVARFDGVHLDPAEFDVILAEHGTSGEWRRAIVCPCFRPDTGTARIDCPHCGGRRYTYPEHLREPMIVLDTQRRTTFKRIAAGELADGTVHLTFPSHVIPSTGDMWLPDGEEHVVTETFVRDGTRRVERAHLLPSRTYVPDHRPVEGGGARVERLLYERPCCVEAVTWEVGAELRYGTAGFDFTVDADGSWRWAAGRGPEPGHAWTVRYRAPAAYMLGTEGASYRTEGDSAMPRLVTARRLDKVVSNDIRPG